LPAHHPATQVQLADIGERDALGLLALRFDEVQRHHQEKVA
jgi:hypothetical protein